MSRDTINEDEFFMAMTELEAICHQSSSGAVIVNDAKKIVGTGYNCAPNGCSDDEVHAEINAIVNRTDVKLQNCTLYVTENPCFKCAQLIIQSGIKKVIYKNVNDKPKVSDGRLMQFSTEASKRLFETATVVCTQWVPRNKTIEINI